MPVFAAEKPLTAAAIVNRAIEASGGSKELRAVRHLTLEGEYEGLGGFPGSFTLKYGAPDRRSLEWDIRYLRQKRGFNGSTGWERNASVRELSGNDLAREKRASLLFPLIQYHDAGYVFSIDSAKSKQGANFTLNVSLPSGQSEEFTFDARTYLLIRNVRVEPFDEGQYEIATTYSDYRRVGRLQLPFTVIEISPGQKATFHVRRYDMSSAIPNSAFENPELAGFSDPYSVTITTIPTHIYKVNENPWHTGIERHWGVAFMPSESWTVNFVVNEAHGRTLHPVLATLQFLSGEQLVKTEEFPQSYLETLRRFPVSRFAPQPEIFSFRHSLSEPTTLRIDRMVYHLTLESPKGERFMQSLSVPVTTYHQSARMIFPVRGHFIVTAGHEAYELQHSYEWTQQFAIDINPLGPDFEFATNEGRNAEDYFAFGRTEVVAPADGTVVYARNDVPDGEVPSSYLKRPDGIMAIAGNYVVIDHGSNEFSVFGHMHQGSIRVQSGETVKQGQVIGLVGAAGSPKLPHLHYQLQADPRIFHGDGLPVEFDNVEAAAWIFDGAKMGDLKRGVYYTAQ